MSNKKLNKAKKRIAKLERNNLALVAGFAQKSAENSILKMQLDAVIMAKGIKSLVDLANGELKEGEKVLPDGFANDGYVKPIEFEVAGVVVDGGLSDE